MSGYLLDTNVISLLSPARNAAPAKFLEWLSRMGDEGVFLSVVTLHDIEKGIALLKAGARRRKRPAFEPGFQV